MNNYIFVCGIVGAVGSYIAQLLGGWDSAVQTLLFFMVVDCILGFLCAAFWSKSPKSTNGGLSSQACWKGIVKKCGTFLIVACCTAIDRMLGTDYVRNAAVIAFCVAELISIVETAGIMGLIPPAVKRIIMNAIDMLKGNSDDDNKEDKNNENN